MPASVWARNLPVPGPQSPAPRQRCADDDAARVRRGLSMEQNAVGETRAAGRRQAARTTTVFSCMLVWFALTAPEQLSSLQPAAFARIPAEGLAGVALILLLPPKAVRVAAPIVGFALGLMTVVRVLDIGSFAVVDRPFDPVLDWSSLGSGLDYLTASMGRFAAIGAAIGAVVLAVTVFGCVTLSVRRLTRIVIRHGVVGARSVAVLAVAWVAFAVFGIQFFPGQPAAAASVASLAYGHALSLRASLLDHERFTKQLASDPFVATPGEQLLSALRGKDVSLAFVESYGRSAIEDPRIGPGIDAVLASGTSRLRAAGFASQSAWLNSPTSGGGSWLAHSTLQSGAWVDNQQRYNTLLASNRLTLSSAFRRAGWRTVAVLPGTNKPWPQGSFYKYDVIYTADNLGYRGPGFSWAPMPDQYALSAFHRSEVAAPHHAPVMADIALVSSHAPWAPIPRLVRWDSVGDGSVFDPQPAAGKKPSDVWRDPNQVRAQYARSIEYSLNTLFSYMATYATKDTVLIFLGDHQPARIVTADHASRDVPIAIVAHDPAVLKRIGGWGWQNGLEPAPQAPVKQMSVFRDNFLSAFSPRMK